MKTFVGALCLAFLSAAASGLAAAEQESWRRGAAGERIYVNLPAAGGGLRQLVIYATPNGNTIEQTLGCQIGAGLDWHYDIQHVAAQVRRWRELSGDESIALAVVEAPGLSWPRFRQEHQDAPARAGGLVKELAAETQAERVTLAVHSGGGSFMFAVLDSAEQIPALVERIVFLDANYAYADSARHGEKLLAWLQRRPERQLVVVAYDDRNITLNGKKVVSETGGTFRASERMLARFRQEVSVEETSAPPLRQTTALGGRLEIVVHTNPENRILHTALVGEMNGLLYGLSRGTPQAGAIGALQGPRAYVKCIQPTPSAEPQQPRAVAKPSDRLLRLPVRPAGAISGTQFLARIESLPPAERERAIQTEILSGNVPPALRGFCAIEISAGGPSGKQHSATLFVLPDYLAVGADDDFFRLPMTPQTAQAIAEATDCSLITAKISDDIFAQAQVRLIPRPLTKDRELPRTFIEHHRLIETQRAGAALGQLVAGIKKDVVLTNRLLERPRRVALYGWHQADGKPIQPLYVGHVETYVDYSHGIRLVGNDLIVDGKPARFRDVAADPERCVLVSGEGPLKVTAAAPGK